MRKQILTVLTIVFMNIVSFGQTFEGWITYKMEALNPMPTKISDSAWQEVMKEQFGELGYMIQKYSYKDDKYISEMDMGKEKGFQAFNPKNKLLYSWKTDSDTATTINSQKYMDELIEITDLDLIDTIMGIPCKSVMVKSKMGQMTIWYNSNYLKMDYKYYKGHIYGHWEQILKKTGCLPLKVEQKMPFVHIVQTVIDYEETEIDNKQFEIPKFKKVIKNPVN